MKKSLNVFAIIISVLSICCAIGIVYLTFSSELDALYIVESISNLLALIYAFFYCFHYNFYYLEFLSY